MAELLPRRRLLRGAACMLFAACWLLARLIAPAAAMPVSQADAVALAALQTLCHGGDAPADPAPAHTDCLLCPACHLMAQVALPAPGGPEVSPPRPSLIARSAPLPPATGPPTRRRAASPPTGPPPRSV